MKVLVSFLLMFCFVPVNLAFAKKKHPTRRDCDAIKVMAEGIVCVLKPSRLNSKSRDRFGDGSRRGFGYHVLAIPRSDKNKNRLYVHFVESGSRPFDPTTAKLFNTRLIKDALKKGYTLIAPAYHNRYSVNSRAQCSGKTGASVQNCAGRTREENFFGMNSSPVINVPYHDSIHQRLKDIISYSIRNLWRMPPSVGMEGIIDSTTINMGGFLNGAGQALYLAKIYQLNRVCVLNGQYDVPDKIPNSEKDKGKLPVADWLLTDFATKKKRIRNLASTSRASNQYGPKHKLCF